MRVLRSMTLALLGAALFPPVPAAAGDGNRLTYLDGDEPYYVSRAFPKLTAAQWVGEPGVEAVVVLAIDDMRDAARYEAVLRPALDRLKKIDGRAPVSIMACKVDPADPQIHKWLGEGLSIEAHTIDHPCPILAGGDFAKAKSTYDRCVDLVSQIPGNRPVAFRTPCCDSLDTPGPRLWGEVFNKVTEKGNFLTIDSSVFNVITPNDPDLPRRLVFDEQGRDRFRRYLPFPSFVNTVEDYPYPYVINKLCWQFPCVVPSDWESFNIQKNASPRLLEDWKAALDATVIKGGTFTLVFHPYGWSSPQQLADLVDYADRTYGRKVKFLTFREAQERLDKNLLSGQPIRAPNGGDNGVRLLDLNGDGYLDVLIGNEQLRQSRVWQPKTRTWVDTAFPTKLVNVTGDGGRSEGGVRFGVLGEVVALVNDRVRGGWRFDDGRWTADPALLDCLPDFTNAPAGRGMRLRDLDGDGGCEVILSGPADNSIYHFDEKARKWTLARFRLPPGAVLTTADGRDAGLRFVDVNGDGHDDVLFSDADHYSLHLWVSMEKGWAREAKSGKRADKSDKTPIPPVVRADGTSNGAWFHSRSMWVQNEDTAGLPDHVDRLSLAAMLQNVEPDTPRGPETALKGLRARPGFRVEQVAAEPLVQDPVAFAWGPDGKFWVVEMGDYPLGVDGKNQFGGRVKFLEDADGDVRYDKATVFLDGLGYPTGVMPWRKGVLVTCAPDIFYAEDTDGDGKADKREVLFTGFKEGNQQHRVNGLSWGLDNWVYGANGESGGDVRSIKTGEVVSISGRDFRFRPDDGAFEAVSGGSQFGRSRDDWGNWFGCNNSNPLWHYPLDEHYLRRNPALAPPPPRVTVPEVPGASPVFPLSRTLPRFNDLWAADHFTSANSAMIYRDDLFGPAFAGNAFISEPVHNLVHREIVTPRGVTFLSRRADDERASEFLTSDDNWFRPTTIKTGPDGSLWVADMYRQVIEHPQWIPKDVQARLDLRAGHDLGRIYRVYPVGVTPRPIPRLDRLDAAGLVAALDHPGGWQRDAAQQLLVERGDKSAVPLLEKLAGESKNPLARLHALCALDGLNALTPDVLRRALADASPGVRRHAARLAELLLSTAPALGEAVAMLADDPDPQVRLQAAYTLGEWNDPRAGGSLARAAAGSPGDPYTAAAVLSSVNKSNLDAVLAAATGPGKVPGPDLLAGLLRIAAATGETHAVLMLLDAAAAPAGGEDSASRFQALAAVLDGLEEARRPLSALARDADEPTRAALGRVAGVFAAARALAADPKADAAARAAAIRLLGREPDRRDADLRFLGGLLAPQSPAGLQVAAVAALGKTPDGPASQLLLLGWKSHSPAVRAAVLDALLARPESAAAVLDAVEAKTVLPADVDAPRRQRLLRSPAAAVRARAARAFAGVVNPDRQKVIDAFAPALTLAGDARRGAPLFAKACAACHQPGGVGRPVGPDLAGVGDKSPGSLTVSILDPNRAVEPRFVGYVAETAAGETLVGILSAESGNSVTLTQADGSSRQILRPDLRSLRSTGVSLMPQGLESGLTPQDLADLMAYVRAGGKL